MAAGGCSEHLLRSGPSRGAASSTSSSAARGRASSSSRYVATPPAACAWMHLRVCKTDKAHCCCLLLCAAQALDYVEVRGSGVYLRPAQSHLYACRQAGGVLPTHWAPKPGTGACAALFRSWMMTMMLRVQSWLSWLATVPAPWQQGSRHSRRKTVRRHAQQGCSAAGCTRCTACLGAAGLSL